MATPGVIGTTRLNASGGPRQSPWLHRNPQWWLLTISGVAWAMLLFGAVRDAAPELLRGWLSDPIYSSLCTTAPQSVTDWSSRLAGWAAMVVAMTLPGMWGPLRLTALSSFRRRRKIAMLLFLTGLLAVWLPLGLAFAASETLLRSQVAVSPAVMAAAVLCLSVGWHFLPVKRAAVVRCHFTIPLAPTGVRANLDCLRFGSIQGTNCVAICWLPMLALSWTAHSVIAMAAVTAIGVAERYKLPLDSPWPPIILASVAVAIGSGLI